MNFKFYLPVIFSVCKKKVNLPVPAQKNVQFTYQLKVRNSITNRLQD